MYTIVNSLPWTEKVKITSTGRTEVNLIMVYAHITYQVCNNYQDGEQAKMQKFNHSGKDTTLVAKA